MNESDALIELFCDLDDFPGWHGRQVMAGERQRRRASRLAASEIMTLLVSFHPSQYRNFKAYYLLHVYSHLRGAFPGLTSYSRFIALIPAVLIPLCVYLQPRKGIAPGIAFIDSTAIVMCHNRRIQRHKVFQTLARQNLARLVLRVQASPDRR